MELTASALMFSRYRLFGALAGAAVMVAAATTVLINGCFLHALIPATALCLLLAALLRRQTARNSVVSAGVLAAAPLYRSIPWLNLRKVAVSILKMTATRQIFKTTTSNKNILQIFSIIG